jgi:hypothetical protein
MRKCNLVESKCKGCLLFSDTANSDEPQSKILSRFNEQIGKEVHDSAR